MTVENQDRTRSDTHRRRFEFGKLSISDTFRKMSQASRRRLLIISLLALFLLWEVLTRSFSAYYANAHPETALGLRSTNPTALLNRADARLRRDSRFKASAPPAPAPSVGPDAEAQAQENGRSQPTDEGTAQTNSIADKLETLPKDLAKVRSWAEKALARDPLNARAFRILGQLSALTSDEERTKALMKAAARRSHHETVAVYWMLRKSFQDKDFVAALRYADTLLRTRPQVFMNVMPLFGKMAEDPAANPELKQLLSKNPNWRPQFFQHFPRTVSDARIPLDILLSLKDSPTPPDSKDLTAYLNFLIEHHFYDLAYYTWLQFLSAEQLAKTGHLFNGTFDTDLSGQPFDWSFRRGSGVTIQIAAPRDRPGGRALFLQFGPGRVDYRDVTQLVLLDPGSYQLHGRYKSDLVSERGLAWEVTCAGEQPVSLGQSPAVRGSTAEWTDFEFSFTVPEADCLAQYVRLVFDARSASERFISGSIWYDDLQIRREPEVDESLQ